MLTDLLIIVKSFLSIISIKKIDVQSFSFQEEYSRSIQDCVKETEQETLKEQSKPFINLQFIYNVLYQNKFK